LFHNKDGLKLGDALSPLLFNFDIDCAVRSVHVNHEGFKLNGTFQFSVVVACKETGPDVDADKTKYMVMSRDQNAGQSLNIKIDKSSFERAKHLKYSGTNLNDSHFYSGRN